MHYSDVMQQLLDCYAKRVLTTPNVRDHTTCNMMLHTATYKRKRSFYGQTFLVTKNTYFYLAGRHNTPAIYYVTESDLLLTALAELGPTQ
jgi:hypothetical protein